MVPSEEPVEHLSVLYVEDDDRLARLTAQYLRSHGVEVTVVPRGDQALSEVLRARPDVVLVPIYLQDLNRILPKGDFLPVPLLGSLSLGNPIKLEAAESKLAFLQRARQAVQDLAK